MEFAGWILEKASLVTGKLRNLNWNSNEKNHICWEVGWGVVVAGRERDTIAVEEILSFKGR